MVMKKKKPGRPRKRTISPHLESETAKTAEELAEEIDKEIEKFEKYGPLEEETEQSDQSQRQNWHGGV